MSTNQENEWNLSSSQEDYLEAIAQLAAEHGHAHTKDIAELLGVKMPSVTTALRSLAELGLITYQTSHPVSLTFAGKIISQRIMRRHRAFKRFFWHILGTSEEKADEIACKMEHLIDSETEVRFLAFMDVMENWDEASQKIKSLAESVIRINDSREN